MHPHHMPAFGRVRWGDMTIRLRSVISRIVRGAKSIRSSPPMIAPEPGSLGRYCVLVSGHFCSSVGQFRFLHYAEDTFSLSFMSFADIRY